MQRNRYTLRGNGTRSPNSWLPHNRFINQCHSVRSTRWVLGIRIPRISGRILQQQYMPTRPLGGGQRKCFLPYILPNEWLVSFNKLIKGPSISRTTQRTREERSRIRVQWVLNTKVVKVTGSQSHSGSLVFTLFTFRKWISSMYSCLIINPSQISLCMQTMKLNFFETSRLHQERGGNMWVALCGPVNLKVHNIHWGEVAGSSYENSQLKS